MMLKRSVLSLLLALLGPFAALAQDQQGSPFTVADVPVDVTAQSAVEARDKARGHGDYIFVFVVSCESDDMIGFCPGNLQLAILAAQKEIGFVAAKTEGFPGQVLLDPAIVCGLEQTRSERAGIVSGLPETCERFLAAGIIDWTAVIRIDEAEIP